MNKNNILKEKYDYKYYNSSRGFIVNKISEIFKPSRFKKKQFRNNIWKPECNKENVYEKLMNYIIIMKEKYPLTNGYICNYCKKPFTFITNFSNRGMGVLRSRPKNDPLKAQNFSIDRWDSRITYTYDNIRFCCKSCNNRKSSSTPDDWNNFKEAQYEDR